MTDNQPPGGGTTLPVHMITPVDLANNPEIMKELIRQVASSLAAMSEACLLVADDIESGEGMAVVTAKNLVTGEVSQEPTDSDVTRAATKEMMRGMCMEAGILRAMCRELGAFDRMLRVATETADSISAMATEAADPAKRPRGN